MTFWLTGKIDHWLHLVNGRDDAKEAFELVNDNLHKDNMFVDGTNCGLVTVFIC